MRLEISSEELKRRRERVFERMAEKGLDALCLFDPQQIFYLTNFSFIATERPMCLILAGGKAWFFVPELEGDHVELYACDVIVRKYPEYPSTRHPMLYLKDLFEELGLSEKRIGCDGDGAPAVYGYRGPKLSELLPRAKIEPARDLVEEMMRIKSDEEIFLIKESVRWGNLAHRLLQEYTRPGLFENEISLRASLEATMAMVKAYGEKDRSFTGSAEAVFVGFRGQIGKYSAYPHSLTRNAIIRKGDVLITGTGPAIGGYRSELERTMIVGEPTKDQEKYFKLMLELQEAAFEAIRPGVPCKGVDAAVRKVYEERGIMKYWRHHTGHGLGIGIHEAPFLDIGDETALEPGMVLSVEPGIFIPGFAGFRHSDTVLVTEKGMEILTYYPRDLESLVIP
ncbi:aminopeptidase P family protein [Candidatus Bipolaricaulota bacterium]|nr:aminopeptidase P family protein [Candidatus Bipolaricaulota bacterium]